MNNNYIEDMDNKISLQRELLNSFKKGVYDTFVQ